MEEKIEQMKLGFRVKYNYLSEDEVEEIFEKALMIYLQLQYPLHQTVTTIPVNNPRGLAWVRACMQEILERDGASSATGYSENGLRVEYDSSMVSKTLIELLTPYGKIVRRT